MFTANDKTSARVDYDTAEDIYIVYENKTLNIRAPMHPRATGIKDIQDITVVSKVEVLEGIKIISIDSSEVVSSGNAKMRLYTQVAENYYEGRVAYKHMPKENVKVSDFTDNEFNIIYLDNKDIVKGNSEGKLVWHNGRLAYSLDNKIYEDIFGIAIDTEYVLYDAYYEMKSALDMGEKVMFILPDGLSIEQIQYYNEDLQLLNDNYSIAASVNPAISNVALAAMLTGQSPYNNGIVQRGVKAPSSPDIFAYATSLGLNVSYIEGNSNLVVTSVNPVLNIPDTNGHTDSNVYNSALTALNNDPDLIFIHFHGIDDVGHEYSPISEQAKNKIINIEGYIMNLMAAFDGVVIILPDHGMIKYYDEENVARGRHGIFEPKDMFVPYYIFNRIDD